MGEQLKIGDVLHCKGTGILSKMIGLFTHSKITHTALYIEVWGQPFIIDSQKDGTNLRPLIEWTKTFQYRYIITRPCFDVNQHNLCIRALSKSGNTRYDFKSLLIRQPIRIITGIFKTKKNEEENMVCSEFVAWCYKIPNSNKITPAELFEYCKANSFKEIN